MYLNYCELDADIIIIGSGLTGLGAAYYLLEKNPHCDFIILDVEEKNKYFRAKADYSLETINRWLGNTCGKKRTSLIENFKSKMINYDILFACSKQKELMSLLETFGISSLRMQSENYGQILVDYDYIYKYSRREDIFKFFPSENIFKFYKVCSQIDDIAKNVLKNPKKNCEASIYLNMSMETLLNNLCDTKIIKDVISQAFYINCGFLPRDVSALFFLTYCNSIEGIGNQFQNNMTGLYQHYLNGGIHSLKLHLCELIDGDYLVKVSDIREIHCYENSVEIRTSKENFHSNKIIFTLTATEISKIKFEPPLPNEKNSLFDNFIKSTLKKFKVTYKEPFWTKNNLSGDVYVMNTEHRNGPIQICLNASKLEEKSYVLVGLADLHGEKTGILKQLAIYLGKEAMEPMYFTEDCSSFLDTYFFSGCQNMNYFQTIKLQSERIIWACPETTPNWYGTAAGSLRAGFIGAIRILYELNPSILNCEERRLIDSDDFVIPPRKLGVFGVKWHLMIPVLLLSIYLIPKLTKFLTK